MTSKNQKFILPLLSTLVILLSLFLNLSFFQKPKQVTPTKAESSRTRFTVEIGKIETVFDWSSQKCEREDIPDGSARAFIDDSGNVQLIVPNIKTRRWIGDNLNQLRHSCNVVFNSHHNPDPRMYDDNEWITPYTLDGKNIYAIIHTEYHGWEHNNCKSSNVDNCWWNSLNLAYSSDSGRHYTHAPAPNHNILNSPVDYDPKNTQGQIGFFQPGKIVQKDGYYYTLVIQHNPPEEWGTCLMRTQDLSDPKSWRLWDGQGFNAPVGQTRCKNVPGQAWDLTYNTYLGKYLSLLCNLGYYCEYVLSDDLIHWEQGGEFFPGHPEIITEINNYASIIQPGDSTRNFEESGRSPWIYYTECEDGKKPGACPSYDRNLKRIRIRLNKPGDEGRYELIDLQMNEKKGTLTLDSAFYGNDGSISGNAIFVNEGSRNFLRFTSGKIQVPHNESLNLDKDFTILFLARTTTTPEANKPSFIIKKGESKKNYYLYVDSNNLLSFGFTDNSSPINELQTTSKINDGNWHKIAVAYNHQSGIGKIFFDGRKEGEKYLGKNLSSSINNNPIIIGENFKGDIDYLTIYNYILNELSDQNFYSPTSTPPPPTPTIVPCVSGYCNPAPEGYSTTCTVDWADFPGAPKYALRIDDLANGSSGSCQQPLLGDYCLDTTESKFTFTGIAGHKYNWWFHYYRSQIGPLSEAFGCPQFTAPTSPPVSPTPTSIPILPTTTPTSTPFPTTYCLAAECTPTPLGSATTCLLDWADFPNVSKYALRIDDRNNGVSGSCQQPLLGDYCLDTTESKFTFTAIAGHKYGWWFHYYTPMGHLSEGYFCPDFIVPTSEGTVPSTPTPSPTVYPTPTPTPTPIPPALNLTNLRFYAPGRSSYGALTRVRTQETYYKDRPYILKTVPSELQKLFLIKTYNGDRNYKSSPYLSFEVNKPVTIYIAYDRRATSLPSWMKDFVPTNWKIEVFGDFNMGYFKIYEKQFPAGAITLGGNSGPSTRAKSNYIVIVK